MDRNYWKEHPYVSVGIMECPEISFELSGNFLDNNGESTSGSHTVSLSNGLVKWKDQTFEEVVLTPQDSHCLFQLKDVTIGIDYHWQRKEVQSFPGTLKLLAHGNKIIAINNAHIEDYLLSVISSEMKATASLEFLKASAIISRSWLLKQIENRHNPNTGKASSTEQLNTEQEVLTWSDREDHTLFDVCADDHCQRYQGIQKASCENVRKAINETFGTILTDNDEICDARFAKSCGGVSEEYEYCWDNQHINYLSAVADVLPGEHIFPDLTIEKEAEKWIRSNPPSFCNTKDKAILGQVLNDYDLETPDFYRWRQEYSQTELRSLIEEHTSKDFGEILDLQPLLRGQSGRIYKMRIVGKKRSLIIGKELEIRRVLSTSHLYSSAFIVEKSDITDGVPQHFTLLGAGWGHGVGMCQIGAAVMGVKGYTYKDILLHYYQGASIEKIY